MPDKTLTRRERQQIAACDAAGLRILLVAQENALLMLRYLAEWLRQGGASGAGPFRRCPDYFPSRVESARPAYSRMALPLRVLSARGGRGVGECGLVCCPDCSVSCHRSRDGRRRVAGLLVCRSSPGRQPVGAGSLRVGELRRDVSGRQAHQR